MKTLLVLAAISLTGCATIHEHPYATSFAVAFVAGSIAASAHHDDQRGAPVAMAHITPPVCANGSCN